MDGGKVFLAPHLGKTVKYWSSILLVTQPTREVGIPGPWTFLSVPFLYLLFMGVEK